VAGPAARPAGGDIGPDTAVADLDAARARRRKRRLVLTAAAAAVVTACAVASALVGPGSTTTARAPHEQHAPAVASGAGAFLDGVANVSYAQQAPTAPYWRMRLVAFDAGGADRPVSYTEWLSRKGVTVAVTGTKYTKPIPRGLSWSVGASQVDWNALDKLPTDPKVLAERFAKVAPSRAFLEIGQLLGESPATPALRSALYRVLAGLNGVVLGGEATDSTGRHGTAVEFNADTVTERLVVVPTTGVLLEESTTARKPTPADPQCTVLPGNPGRCLPAFHVGELIHRITYLEVGPATSPN
jgi:hypothetical protein